jgi:hypothetical protein
MDTMDNTISSREVCWFFLQAKLSPFMLGTYRYQIVYEGDNYIVDTEFLPEIFIEKIVPLYFFEYRGEDRILSRAMDLTNIRRTPGVVFRVLSSDTVTFRCYLNPGSAEALPESFDNGTLEIGRAIGAFGRACYTAIKEDGLDNATVLRSYLADNPMI